MSFTTIVATEQTRQQFTALRDKLKATDKLLMQACWDMVQELLFIALTEEDVARRIDKLRADQKVVRDAMKPLKAAAKPKKEKEKKEKAPKVPKAEKAPAKPAKSKKKLLKEAPVVLNEGERIIAEDDDVPCFVSVGV